MRGSKKHRKGFSLAEAMMATVVLGIAAAGVLLPFMNGASIRAEGEHRTLAAKLASDLMEEIIRTDFDQIISKYGTYSEPQGHIVKNFDTAEEFTDTMYANFSRGTSYEYDASQPFFIIIKVWVRYDENEIVSLSRLISK